MVHDPELIIADEPTGNLDPLISWEIIQLLLRINELGHDRPDGHPQRGGGDRAAQARRGPGGGPRSCATRWAAITASTELRVSDGRGPC